MTIVQAMTLREVYQHEHHAHHSGSHRRHSPSSIPDAKQRELDELRVEQALSRDDHRRPVGLEHQFVFVDEGGNAYWRHSEHHAEMPHIVHPQ